MTEYLDQVAALVAADIPRAIAAGEIDDGYPSALTRRVEARLPRPAGISQGDLAGHVRAATMGFCGLSLAEGDATMARCAREHSEAQRMIDLINLAKAHGFANDAPLLATMQWLRDHGLIDEDGNILP